MAILLQQNFDSLADDLQPFVSPTEHGGDGTDWTHTAPEGWSVASRSSSGGVLEFKQWTFMDPKSWAASSANNREQFTKGSGVIAIADGDEFSDATPGVDLSTTLRSPSFDVTAASEGALKLTFDSSWLPYGRQEAVISIAFDGGEPIVIDRWSSSTGSADYKGDAINETVNLLTAIPEGAKTAQIFFDMPTAGNDWWWAIDNIVVSTASVDDIQTPPVATDDDLGSIGEAETMELSFSTLLANDHDAEGHTLTVSSIAGTAVVAGAEIDLGSGVTLTVNADATGGILSTNGQYERLGDGETGTFSFDYEVTDGKDVATGSASFKIEGEGTAEAAKKVIFVGLDGALLDDIRRLIAEGRITDGFAELDMLEGWSGGEVGTPSQQTTGSGPGWSTLLTGVWVDEHGVASNNNRPINEEIDSVFERIDAALPGADISSFGAWAPVNNNHFACETGQMGDPAVIDRYTVSRTDDASTADIIDLLANGSPDFIFTHWDEPDVINHNVGRGAAYDQSLIDASNRIAEILDAMAAREAANPNEDWMLITSTDHGINNNRGHGGQTEQERQIFIGASEDLSNLDPDQVPQTSVVPTILDFMGIDYDEDDFYSGSLLEDEPQAGGTEGDDELAGTSGDDVIDALAGDDTVSGEEGNDSLDGGEGDDSLDGGEGDDVLKGGVGDDSLIGRAGSDILFGGEGDDTLDGGDGVDTADFSDDSAGVVIDLSAGTAEGDEIGADELTSIENVIGGAGDDVLVGDQGDNLFAGGAGDDTINGGEGFDTLDVSAATGPVSVDFAGGRVSGAGLGSDSFRNIEKLLFGAGDDTIIGNSGDDAFDGGAGNDTLKGGAGDDKLWGGDGNDALDGGSGDDAVNGGQGNDTVKAGSGDDTVDAGDGDDVIDAGSGDDVVLAGAGNDVVEAGSGDDRIEGGAGDDLLSGGSGADTFVFASEFGKDTIEDFKLTGASADLIEFATDLFADFDAAIAAAEQIGSDTVFAVDADTSLTLRNVQLASLEADHFQFV